MRTRLLCPALALAILLLACQPTTEPHSPETAPAADTPTAATGVAVTNAWARATLPQARAGAAYFTITNGGSTADTLVSLASTAAAKAELHQTLHEGGMARMRPVGEIKIEPGQTVKAEPGGLHVMLLDLKQPLAVGSTVPLELNFRVAGTVHVQVSIVDMTAVSQD